MKRTHEMDKREMELAELLMAKCYTTGDIQAKLKKLFAGTIEQMLEAKMDEHLGYEKNSVCGSNIGNSRNGYGKKTINSDYGQCEILVSRDRNGEFEPNQLFIVHQIRNSCKVVPYKDRKAVCADLKKIYSAVNLDEAEFAKEEFREMWDKKYQNILKSWDKNQAESPCFSNIHRR